MNTNKPSTVVFLRFLVVLFSFCAAILGAKLSGTEVDGATIETFSNAILIFLGASGATSSRSRKRP